MLMNNFVDYLNSTNNVGGDSTGSLAETQVKSPYYDLIKVDRKLGSYIAETIRLNEHKAFILTGHAGDGKTSILVQVLKELQLIQPGEGLSVTKEYEKFFYVKDMSEISEDIQVKVLEKALEFPKNGKSSLLISNTGPLIHTFLKLVEQSRNTRELSSIERDEIQSKLLTQMDKNTDQILSVEGYEFELVNIARVDNVIFAKRILNKIINPEIWSKCSDCNRNEKCPIINNINRISKQWDRVSDFIENYYRYLFENDKRMTIRQMVGQISYAITGNLVCSDIINKDLKEPLFNYNFANLFFGYRGLDEAKDSLQIKGISQMKQLELDKIALDVDYQLFVNNDYSVFLNDIEGEISNLYKKHRSHYLTVRDENSQGFARDNIEMKIRRAIRRFYLIYGTHSKGADGVYNQIFCNSYSLYRTLTSSKASKIKLRDVQNSVYKALYKKNTGYLPDNGEPKVPLTLSREDGVFQNVMLILGEIDKRYLEIVQKTIKSRFEDVEGKQELYLKINKQEFLLTLPMLAYFEKLIQGSIISNNNPALTHGIAKLDAMLLEEYGYEPLDEEECELKILINTANGQKVQTFTFSEGKLIL